MVSGLKVSISRGVRQKVALWNNASVSLSH